jgi:HEAT repeat protein
MGFVSNWIPGAGLARLLFEAILAALAGIVSLLAFILGRRTYRGFHFRVLNARTFALRQRWDDLVSGKIPPSSWRFNRVDRQIVESILLDSIETAAPAQLTPLVECLRSTGLLDMRIYEARSLRGWQRRNAMVSLGRTRAPEAIPALAEGLDDSDAQTRLAAVRGLGRFALPDAAAPLLARIAEGTLNVPEKPLQNSLLSCCREQPSLLVPCLRRAEGSTREMLARVLGELATPELEDDLLLLAVDPLPEVRASAARALARADAQFAFPILSALTADPEWFVRLRAVVAIDTLNHPRSIPALVRALCDVNRQVRQRAATALSRLEPHIEEILERVLATRDAYALQAMISALERSGGLTKLVEALKGPRNPRKAAAILLRALHSASERLYSRATNTPGDDDEQPPDESASEETERPETVSP